MSGPTRSEDAEISNIYIIKKNVIRSKLWDPIPVNEP